MQRRLLVSLLLAANALGQAQSKTAQPKTVDCSLDGKAYTCSRADLVSSFAEARTVAIDAEPRDRVGGSQVASFAKSVAKEVVPLQGAPDLVLRLVRTPTEGVSVGPSDMQLATLRIFSSKGSASRLVWVETYRGQPDVPWPAVVRALTQQLQATLAGR